MAHVLGQFEEGRGKAIRFRPGADTRILDWTRCEQRGLHFETRTPDVSAHIFFGDADLTDSIRPQRRGFTNQAVMERAAALIATNPIIRAGLLELWRDTSLSVGGAIMITKNIDEYMPEAHGVFHLIVSDPAVSARYRFRRGIAATRTLESEIAYLKKRDKLHLDNGLEYIPKRATTIDMTPLLLRRSGFQRAAHMMVDDLRNKFISA